MLWFKKKISIEARPSQDASVCDFILDTEILKNNEKILFSSEHSNDHPLVKRLFEIEGILSVLVFPKSLRLQKNAPWNWKEKGAVIGKKIRDGIYDGGVNEDLIKEEKEKPVVKHPLASRVQKLLDDHINPSVASHGGKISMVNIEDGILYVEMSGGCQGCGMAQATLREGVEKAILGQLPELTKVVDVTDHSGGENPYYK